MDIAIDKPSAVDELNRILIKASNANSNEVKKQ
jgi:hypothetical protein